MGYHVRIDQDLCMSSGRCVADAPSVFRFDRDELAEIIADPEVLEDERLLAIARNCPGRAITLLGADGTEVPY